MVAMHLAPLLGHQNPCLWLWPGKNHRPGGTPGRGRGALNRPTIGKERAPDAPMSASDQAPSAVSSRNWLVNQPYLLLSITALCWAGNAIVGRLAAGHIPPVTVSFLRWWLAFLIILPLAWKHLSRDWPAIRARLGTM